MKQIGPYVISLHNAIAAVCPIHGVSTGDPNDKATWRIDFHESANAEQRKAAEQVMAAFSDMGDWVV